MILMADGSFGFGPGGESRAAGEVEGGADGGEDLSMDLDVFFHILEESSDPSQSGREDVTYKNLKVESSPHANNHDNFQLQSGFQMLEGPRATGARPMDPAVFYPVYNSERSDAGIGGLVGSFDCVGNFGMGFDDVKGESSPQISFPMHTFARTLKEWHSPLQGDQGTERVGVLQSEIPSCSTTASFVEGDAIRVTDHGDDLDLNLLLGETGTQFRHLAGNTDSKDASQTWMDSLDGKFGYCGALIENNTGILEPENDSHKSMGMCFMDADGSSHNVISTKSTSRHNSDVTSELGAHYSAIQFGLNEDNALFTDSPQYYFPGDFNFELLHNNEGIVNNERDEIRDLQNDSACSVSEISTINCSDVQGLNFKCEESDHMSSISGKFSYNADNDKPSLMPFGYNQSGISTNQTVCIKDETIGEVAVRRSMMWRSFDAGDEAFNRKYPCNDENDLFVDKDSKQSSSGVSPSMQIENHAVYTKDEKGNTCVAHMRAELEGSEQYLPCHKPSIISNKQLSCTKDEREGKMIQPKGVSSHLSRVSPESIQSNSYGSKSHVDDDPDICILEDISQPACSNQPLAPVKAIVPLQRPAYSDSPNYMAVGGTRVKAHDERFVLQVALQDLSQPRSETSPPDGVLAVPLLRHQRIALSWMVQKETSSLHCSGGILADDQGLGKTISTIALILKERPLLQADPNVVKKEEFETLNLDDDDDEVTEVDRMKQDSDTFQVTSKQSSIKSRNSLGQSKGRPAAGTLVVCPTSVLRQWAEELHKKVSSEANLSVLVYHGSNRTKDPCELAKYDVVLTTYSIVSMEVPKQPLADEDDDEKGKLEGDDVPLLGLSSDKKRKYPPTSGKKGSKNKKGMDSALFDSIARPLAKVGWFRVVLDEAQSIKNHRTQVARACWGLRAKRRWCLSGTPIQNAIDDLYSYFRFLRYDPYAGYKSFCSTIKIPIQKSPAKGYKKLQAVLKTIMLRRTKGTLIDGKPIINLPPKSVELKKVDFTEEERDFYTRLEADSRAQFKEYADAGTVKQNYVNILLMLLRLRQACDHPLLVRGLGSSSLGRSSIEIAKKLPRDKQICLLNCLEASLALCGICNDPPEDAVVSVCGHVFCNQCICEHLTGDDSQCPTANCKVRLNVSLVFSKATLSSSLSDLPVQESAGSELVEAINSYTEGCPYDSSKIKAALEVLQSLTKPPDCRSTHSLSENSLEGNDTCPENSSSSGNSLNDNTDGINHSMKVVGEKAIVFSQWTRMLDLLEACLKNSSIQYRRLDGTMSVVARDKAVKDFNTLPEVSVMIMSLKAASLGLNMVAACRVLLLDLWWNPTTEDQAIDRAHRIGQTRPVTVLRLTVKDTVEDRILALQQKKREMVASAFGEDETGGRQSRLTVEDLNYLFMM